MDNGPGAIAAFIYYVIEEYLKDTSEDDGADIQLSDEHFANVERITANEGGAFTLHLDNNQVYAFQVQRVS